MKKKLLYVVNTDWYFHLHWLERAIAAKEYGFTVAVAMPINDVEIKIFIEKCGVKVINWNISRFGKNLFQEIRAIEQLRNILKCEGPDLVHSITIKPNIYCFILSRLMKFKLILSVTGLGMLFTSTKFNDLLLSSIVKNIYGLAASYGDIFFENSDDMNFVKSAILGNSTNLRKINGAGVSPSLFQYHAPHKILGSVKIFFGARLLKPKGLDILVDAVKRLNDEGLHVSLIVAGISDLDNPLAISPKEIEAWSHNHFFQFLGQRNDIATLIADSHFVCLPSTYGEGIPRVLIEAAAIGRPLITTDMPGCREICIDGLNGFIVPPGLSQPIVEVLRYIFKNPHKADEMSWNSRMIFEQGYDSHSVIKDVLSVYTRVTAE